MKNDFKQIVLVDDTGLRPWAIEQLKMSSENPIKIYSEDPATDQEIIDRIQDADCVLVSWRTRLTGSILSEAKRLTYIGMCCSLYDSSSSNVDIAYANTHQITVKGIRDYGDEGVVEFVVSDLIRLLKGLGKHQWRKDPVELNSRKVGIIGLGTTGLMLANRLMAFGAEVSYYSRTRKPEAEEVGIRYQGLHELLESSEIVSLHLPRNTHILDEPEFSALGDGKILVNTSLGLTFVKLAFEKWISRSGNFAIFDADGIGGEEKAFEKYENVLASIHVTGWTLEARERLSHKVLDNLKTFLNGQ